MIKQYKLRFYNFRLVVFLLAISFIGIHLVGTAADYLRTRQLLGVIIGVVFMLTLSLMDFLRIKCQRCCKMGGFGLYSISANRVIQNHYYFVFCKIFHGSRR